MESAAVLRPFQCTVSHGRHALNRPGIIPIQGISLMNSSRLPAQGLTFEGKHVYSSIKWEQLKVSCSKTSETTITPKADADSESQGSLEKNFMRSATFPNGFEQLLYEVCDETEIAELKLKIGDFEMYVQRDIESTVSPPPPPPVEPSPVIESPPPASVAPSLPPPKSSTEKISPFKHIVVKSPKLASLEASGATGYVLVSAPLVGSFRRGKTVNGQQKPPVCKEGDYLKKGQVIGFLDQFGTQVPVKSNVEGEILKLLFDEGDAVGYGDPIIAVLPPVHAAN